MTRIWADLGLAWVADTVQIQHGDHASDRREHDVLAQLPVVEDIDKAGAAGIDVLAWVNASNSMRVRAQAIARKAKKGTDTETLRERVYQALKGVRMSGGKVI